METKAEKLARINRMIKTNQESSARDLKTWPKEFLVDKINSLHIFQDTILRSYMDAIEFMTDEQAAEFGKWLDEKYKNNG